MLKKKERRLDVDRRSGYDRRKSRQFNLSGTYFIENRKLDNCLLVSSTYFMM